MSNKTHDTFFILAIVIILLTTAWALFSYRMIGDDMRDKPIFGQPPQKRTAVDNLVNEGALSNHPALYYERVEQ